MDNAALIPISLFAAIAVIVVMAAWYRYRTRVALQETLRAALDKGFELTPEVIDRLWRPKPRAHADLRRALIALAIGIGIAAFGSLVGEEDAVRPMLAIGAIPILIGIAYLLLWRLTNRSSGSSDPPI